MLVLSKKGLMIMKYVSTMDEYGRTMISPVRPEIIVNQTYEERELDTIAAYNAICYGKGTENYIIVRSDGDTAPYVLENAENLLIDGYFSGFMYKYPVPEKDCFHDTPTLFYAVKSDRVISSGRYAGGVILNMYDKNNGMYDHDMYSVNFLINRVHALLRWYANGREDNLYNSGAELCDKVHDEAVSIFNSLRSDGIAAYVRILIDTTQDDKIRVLPKQFLVSALIPDLVTIIRGACDIRTREHDSTVLNEEMYKRMLRDAAGLERR